jgi:MHS family alpha-ketoglutarate permease-like MFS transporter
MIANHRVDPDYITLFIVYVTVVIGVSLLVYIFGLKNKSETVLDREQGSAWVLSR